tara:strand:- start:1601 stop:1750 length:150 start_codon:yes stop_codon:yes gene_type:complete
MIVYTLEDIIGLTLLGFFALVGLYIYVESKIGEYLHKKRNKRQHDKGDL